MEEGAKVEILRFFKRKTYESLVKQGNQDDIEMLLKKDDKHIDAVLKAFNIKVHF